MFLKRLEVFGFKSFADRLDISFSNGITAIVGPNGSGKSNVSDAVRWVLGEQSAKQLRGAAMADVIFKGTESRKPLSYCEVSLVFDNTDKGLEIDYTEVVITRRLYRNGDSEYYINRSGVRLKDIVSLFQDTGIGKEGYSIVGQGKIENILSGKQEDRRAVFEEAAGIVKYKTRKAEAERKLANTSENLSRLNDIIDTLQERIEPLEGQAEVAKQYLALRESLRALEVNFYLVQSELSEQKKQAFNEQLEGIDQEKEEKTLHVGELSAQNEKLIEQIREKDRELAEIRARLLELTAEGEAIQGHNKVLEERIQNTNGQLERIKNEIENNIRRKSSMEDAINGDVNAEQNKKATIQAEKEQIAQIEAEIIKQDELLDNEGAELERLKAEMLENMNRLSDVRSNMSRLEAMQKSILQRREKLTVIKEQLLLKRTGLEEALNEQQANAQKFLEEQNKLKEIKERLTSELNSLIAKKDGASETFNKKQADINGARSRLKVLEELKRDFDGFNFSVKKLMTESERNGQISRHISGVIAQIINVPEKYEVAIEAALGSAMQNIVTPTEEDAKALIEFLRTHDAGRATFLPISAIRGRTLDDKERSEIRTNGCCGVASELVDYESKYGEIIKSLLGRTVVTESLDDAIRIARATRHMLRIVTLKGDVMNAGGSMSGGSLKQKTSSILGREREIEELTGLIEARNGELTSLRNELLHFDENKKKLEAQVVEADGNLRKLEIAYAHDFEKLNSLRNDMQNSLQSENELTLEDEQLSDTLKEIENDIESIKLRQGNVESSNTDAQASINQRQADYNKKKLEREKLLQRLTDIKIECTGLEKELDAMQSNRERLGELIQNLVNANAKLENDANSYGQILNETVIELEKGKENGEKSKTDIAEASLKEKQGTEEREGLDVLTRENENTRRRFEQEIYDAGERRHKIELQLTKLENDLSYLENRIWEEYELTKATAEELRDPEFKLSGAQTEINKYKREISSLGNVNVNAIEEYVETKEKFDTMSSQRDDLQKAENDLINIIDELTKKMDKQFSEQFALINANFTKVFSELFGGGKAELKLEQAENSLEANIEIVAQPPGKSLQLLSLLSGGERALTAIAILFAMMKLKPTPFCILDEIEAALDEANVGNVATYLRKFSEQTQFIVITHRKPTMEEADSLYGVAMEEKGVSKIVSVKLT